MAPEPYYAVIFDAGSTSTRPYFYRITPKGLDDGHGNVPPGQVVEVLKHGGRPLNKSPEAVGVPGAGGIHKQTTDEALKAHLDPPFNDVAETLEHLPALTPPVKYYLLATGGVRDHLDEDEQEILSGWVTAYVGGRGIVPDNFEYRAISGVEEAKYGWVAAHRSLGRSYNDGYVEMGGATAQIAFPLPAAHYDTAAQVVTGLNQPAHQVKLEDVGPQQQKLFLASYPLGSNAGYEAYKNVIFAKEENDNLNINGGVEGDKTIFYDPSKREGYPEKEYGNRIIRSIPPGTPRSDKKLATTLYLVGSALHELFPGAAITADLDEPVISKLDFIGASNFWYSMCGALNDGALDIKTFQKNTKEKSKMTHTQFREMHIRLKTPKNLLPIYDNSTFMDRWTLHVLRGAFGLGVSLHADDEGKNMTFTPYNGHGSNKNRFSWTLGKAVLLASPDLNDLASTPSPPADTIHATA